MTAIRRSTRAKRQAASIYDEAKKLAEARTSLQHSKAQRKKEEAEDDDEEDSESEGVTDSGENSSGDDSDVEDKPMKPKAAVKSPQAPNPNPIKNSGKITIKMGKKKNDTEKQPRGPTDEKAIGRNRAAVVRALALLEKKVRSLWYEGETKKSNKKAKEPDDDSLVLSLLGAAKQNKRGVKNDGESLYTAQLEEIARKIIREHKSDSTKAQVKLLNLIFRSVGGSPATDLNDEDDLNLSDDDWVNAVTNLVEEMRHTPENAILLCADPDGAVHAATEEISAASLGAREYRKIYEEFWYVLGRVALTEGMSKNTGSVEMEDSDNDDSPPRSSLFEVEIVREIVVRISELVTVGQPDVRAGATIAVLQLGLAALDRTVALGAKLDVASRQLNASTKGKHAMKKKAEGLRLQIDSLKRSQAELEEIVAGLLFQAVFLRRYRDSNKHIRAFSMQWLSRLTILRPDIFMMDKYLKYLGWMTSDKAPCVRYASVAGLLAPFKVAKSSEQGRSSAPKFELSAMENVVKKFLPRLADCAIDVDIQVQDAAMELFLALMREDLLADCDDDDIWNQINLRALDPTTSPSVRRNALYFVVEQLEPFHVDEGMPKANAFSEKAKAERLDGIATWIAHNLSDSKIPPEKMRIGLADLVVYSLLDMPEHKDLVTDWPVVLRAIRDVVEANSRTNTKEIKRTEATKQRVLLQILACAAYAQVQEFSNGDFIATDADDDLLMVKTQLMESKEHATKKKHGGQKDYGSQHEALSVALLKALGDFFVAFKGDVTVLKSLTALPRCLLPSVFSLPTHKAAFVSLIKRLSDLYLETSDDQVLENIASSLTFFALGDHARKAEAQVQLKDMTSALTKRFLTLVTCETSENHPKSTITSKDSTESQSSLVDGDNETSVALDNEHSLSTCLKRFRVLSKRCNLAALVEMATDEGKEEMSIEKFCTSIGMMAKARLDARQIGPDTGSAEPIIPATWTKANEKIHSLVANSVGEALSLLLSIIAWQTQISIEHGVLDTDDFEAVEGITEKATDHVVLRLRSDLVKLLQLCWEQCLDGFDLGLFSEEHRRFADEVQQKACHISGDLRSLFPKEWVDSSSALLRSFALTDDGFLVGGSVRYLRSKEEEFRSKGDECSLAENLLLPLSRGLTPNWLAGNRREAGAILAHITGSGQEATEIVTTMSRVLKKIEPLRLLESHMACLRQSYEDWLECEPEELESDRPSEKEMQAFEEAEKRHREKFATMEDQAERLSKSLGVGKLSDPKLSPAILEFVKEGIRFAFSDDEELVLGSRLHFLDLIGRYAIWIRRDQGHRKIIEAFLTAREAELADHPDFDSLTNENLEPVDSFKEHLEMKASKKARGTPSRQADGSIASPRSDDGDRSRRTPSPGPSTSSFRRRLSRGSSVSTKRSRMSAQSSLSPLYEEDGVDDDGEDEDSLPSKRRKVGTRRSHPASLGSQLSVSTLGKTQTTIDEGSGEHSDDSSE